MYNMYNLSSQLALSKDSLVLLLAHFGDLQLRGRHCPGSVCVRICTPVLANQVNQSTWLVIRLLHLAQLALPRRAAPQILRRICAYVLVKQIN
jgi:hypothetical protein